MIYEFSNYNYEIEAYFTDEKITKEPRNCLDALTALEGVNFEDDWKFRALSSDLAEPIAAAALVKGDHNTAFDASMFIQDYKNKDKMLAKVKDLAFEQGNYQALFSYTKSQFDESSLRDQKLEHIHSLDKYLVIARNKNQVLNSEKILKAQHYLLTKMNEHIEQFEHPKDMRTIQMYMAPDELLELYSKDSKLNTFSANNPTETNSTPDKTNNSTTLKND